MRRFKTGWLFVAGVILFTSLVAYRASVIPITHDEASTWLNFRHYNMWSCYENYFCWQTANNHWLNTLLMQGSACIFGDQAWALRLPNVMAGFLYFLAAAILTRRYIQSIWLQLCGFILMTSHLYLLDFFSLFRGYGLMMCGVLWSIYFIMRYIERYELRWLIYSVITLLLAVLSNFTALLPMASIGLVWFIWMLFQKKRLVLFKHSVIWFFAAVFLVWWSEYPIRIMADAGEFSWGSKNFLFMFHNLVDNLLYGSYDIKNLSPVGLLLITLALFAVILILTFRKEHFYAKQQLLWSLGLFVSSLVVIVLNQIITGSNAPLGRQSLFFIPLLFVPLALGLNLITHKTLTFTFGALVSIVLLYHTIRPHQWPAVREWYYDAFYPTLFSSLPIINSSDSIRLGSSWIFTPSLLFYQKTQQLPISGLMYQKPIVIDTTMQYYFVEAADTAQMSSFGFVLQKKIGPFFLFSNVPVLVPSGALPN